MTVLPLWACSFVSGWGGLEGGCRDGQGSCGDAGSPAARDSDAESTHEGGGTGALCGNVHCDYASQQGCCADPRAGGGTCSASTACGSGHSFLWCDTSTECSMLLNMTAYCCLEFAPGSTAQCAQSCSAGYTLCSPNEPNGCPAGKQCMPALGLLPPGYSICM